MNPKSDCQQDEEDKGQKSIDIKNTEKMKGRTVEAIKGNIHKENNDMISTDKDTYWNNLENIETTIIGEEIVEKDSAALIKFSLGDQLADHPKAIITLFEKTCKENMSNLYYMDKSLIIEENWAKTSAKQPPNRKWNNILNYKIIKKEKSQEGNVKLQDYEKVDGFKRI